MRLAALTAIALLALAFAHLGRAQPQLIVNGVDVPGASSSLVSGTTYAPAAALARALGAHFDIDLSTQRLTFRLGARVVQIRTVSDPAAAASVPDALRRDGVTLPGPAGVISGFEPFVPVKATAEALGATVSFLGASNQVLVVAPRAEAQARLDGRPGDERLVLRLSAPVRVSGFLNEAVQTLELRLERTQVAQPSSFVGAGFVRADVTQDRGDVRVRVQLAPDTRAHWVEVPDGAGFAVVVSFQGAAGESAPIPSARAGAKIVLDPGSGAVGDAAALTLEAARVAAQQLTRAGFEIELTRTGAALPSPSERSALGAGARLFVSLQVADVPAGTARIYYLGDAADLPALEDAVRVNAEVIVQRPEIDAVRRALLTDLVPDLALGERYAAGLAAGLRGVGFQVAAPRAAPVALLTGAAGRGVLVEVSAADLRDPLFASRLATLLAEIVPSADPRP